MREKLIFVVTDSYVRYKDFIRENRLDGNRWRFCDDHWMLHGRENFDVIMIAGSERMSHEKLEAIQQRYMTAGKRGRTKTVVMASPFPNISWVEKLFKNSGGGK